MSSQNPFDSLVGEELNIVAFVMDYVDFHFNGPRVTAFTRPIVRTSEATAQFPAPGSRDALCSLIGHQVRRVSFQEDRSLEFTFESDVTLIIPLDEGSYLGPEALHWHSGDNLADTFIW